MSLKPTVYPKWVQNADTTWTLQGMPFAPIAAAAYAALPAHLREIPTATPAAYNGWKLAHYAELAARLVGGTWAEAWASKAIQNGTPAAEAITAARAAAPASSPASFPRIVEALKAAGRAVEAAWVQTGQAPAAIAPTSSTSPTSPAAADSSAVVMVGLVLLIALGLGRGRRR